ncbi:S9 family peptidase [Glycocaulis profundi]|nr:S9 family peptidase [Glycocaulis profundi]
MIRLLAAAASVLALSAGAFAQPGPGEGPDPELEAIEPSAERVNVGLASDQPQDIARYLLANGAISGRLSPDGEHVAVMSDITGVRQWWIVPASGGQPRQLTFGNGATFAAWAPDSSGLIYGADNDGNEQEAYFRISLDGLEESRVLDAERGAFRTFGEVLRDGRRIVYASTERTGLHYDMYVMDLETGEREMVFEGEYAFWPHPVSPDGRWLIMSERVGEDSNNLYLLDIDSGETRTVYEPEPRANSTDGGFAWAPDGSGFHLATNQDREFAALAFYSLESGETEIIEEAEFDIQNVNRCGPDGRFLIWTTNEDGFIRLHGRDLQDGSDLAIPELDEGVYTVSCEGESGKATIRVNGWRTPGELSVWDVASGETTVVWAANLAGLDPERLVRPESVRMTARDGVELQGLLYLPREDARTEDGPPPVVFDVHGGPTAQSVVGFEGPAQYLLNRGIAVFKPNVRGSTGFGRTYTTLDDRENRLDSIADLVDMLAFLREDGRVDADRAAVKGGSYGGYAVNAVLATFPGEFVAGASLYGVADWVSALEVASPSLKASDRIEYGDISEPEWREFYEENSPINQADQITVPVLYSHGVQDPRIDVYETEVMVRTLRENGVRADYIRIPDEGHGWRRLSNRLFYFRREAAFLEEMLSE